MKAENGIKKFRERMRWNQAQLAERVDLLQSTVSSWEKGKNVPSYKIAKKLLELGATVEELFGLEYNKMHDLTKAEFTHDDLLREFRELKARMAVLEGKKEPTVVAQMG